MKVVALHGLAIKASRLKLTDLKQKLDINNVVVYENGVSSQEIIGGLMTTPLIEEERLVVLENPPEDLNLSLPPSVAPSNLSLVLWFDHTVSEKKPIMEWVKKEKGEILFFPEAKEVSAFPLLDTLAAKDQKAYSEIKKLKMAGFDIFYFLSMTFYLLRNLVSTPKTAPQFVRQKLMRQRKNFTVDKLVQLYKDILEIDFKLKSGLLEKDQAEFILVNKFTTIG